LAAAAFGDRLYTSSDSGATWAARDSVRQWFSVASSADGTRLVAGVVGGQLYTSVGSAGANQTVAADGAARTVPNFATGFSPGPANESEQTLEGYTVNVESGKSALFSVAPAIANNGTLTYTPAVGPGGSALITVDAQDNGGTANSGVDKSTNTFTITITPATVVAPVLAIQRGSGNVTISWPVPTGTFNLQSTATPQLPGSWTPVVEVPTVTNGTNYLTVPTLPAPPAAVRLFYRLRTP